MSIFRSRIINPLIVFITLICIIFSYQNCEENFEKKFPLENPTVQTSDKPLSQLNKNFNSDVHLQLITKTQDSLIEGDLFTLQLTQLPTEYKKIIWYKIEDGNNVIFSNVNSEFISTSSTLDHTGEYFAIVETINNSVLTSNSVNLEVKKSLRSLKNIVINLNQSKVINPELNILEGQTNTWFKKGVNETQFIEIAQSPTLLIHGSNDTVGEYKVVLNQTKEEEIDKILVSIVTKQTPSQLNVNAGESIQLDFHAIVPDGSTTTWFKLESNNDDLKKGSWVEVSRSKSLHIPESTPNHNGLYKAQIIGRYGYEVESNLTNIIINYDKPHLSIQSAQFLMKFDRDSNQNNLIENHIQFKLSPLVSKVNDNPIEFFWEELNSNGSKWIEVKKNNTYTTDSKQVNLDINHLDFPLQLKATITDNFDYSSSIPPIHITPIQKISGLKQTHSSFALKEGQAFRFLCLFLNKKNIFYKPENTQINWHKWNNNQWTQISHHDHLMFKSITPKSFGSYLLTVYIPNQIVGETETTLKHYFSITRQ